MMIPATVPLMFGGQIVSEVDCQLDIGVFGHAPYRTWGLRAIDLGDGIVLHHTGPGFGDRLSTVVGEAIIEAAHVYWAAHRERLMADAGLVDDEDELEAA